MVGGTERRPTVGGSLGGVAAAAAAAANVSATSPSAARAAFMLTPFGASFTFMVGMVRKRGGDLSYSTVSQLVTDDTIDPDPDAREWEMMKNPFVVEKPGKAKDRRKQQPRHTRSLLEHKHDV